MFDKFHVINKYSGSDQFPAIKVMSPLGRDVQWHAKMQCFYHADAREVNNLKNTDMEKKKVMSF